MMRTFLGRWVAVAMSLMMGVFGGGKAKAEDVVKIGFNYPQTGPYAAQGLDQLRAAELARDEINAAGGILGKKVELVIRDSQSKVDVSIANARELIDKEGVKMIFGGSASSVAIAVGKVCKEANILFFGTLTYSLDTTVKDGHSRIFRACYDAWAGAKVLSDYMNKHFAGKTYFYITADYSWGHTTEASFRKFTNTEDTDTHKGIKTPFPGATEEHFQKAIKVAASKEPDVLVLVLFGKDMELGLKAAKEAGLKEKCQIVVPNLTLGAAIGAGPEVMEGVLGALDWCWRVPERVGSEKGKAYVKAFNERYQSHPCCAGSAAYTILWEYKAAVEAAKSFETEAVIKALEGRKFTLLKDEQYWRPFDHSCVQTVYAVKCKPADEVKKDPFQQDFFEILAEMKGDEAFMTQAEWEEARKAAGVPTTLE